MKVLLFANTAWYLFNFRLALAEALRQDGYEVILVSPPDEYGQKLLENGFMWISFPLSRRSFNPLREVWTVWELCKFYRREKPDLVHHFTIKCVLYGSLAAKLTGVSSVINAVTGLGYVFTSNTWKTRPLQWLTRTFYKLVLKNSQVIFQNPDDRNAFIKDGLVCEEQTHIIPGSGVDPELFHPTEEPQGVPLVILPARLLWDKGVGEFVDAAKIIKGQGIKARFALIGSPDPANPASVPEAVLNKWQQENMIEWWQWQEDMPAVYKNASIVCLPSYREGLPKTLIEAAACGRAIVAADVPGSREVVRHGENGFLVPVSDSKTLAARVMDLISNRPLRTTMGINGRKRVEEEFSSNIIISQTIEIYRNFHPS